MKHPRIVTWACSFLSAAALGLATPAEAPNPPPNPEPPGDPVIAAVNPKPPQAEINDEGPREPRKKRVRIERRGPGNQLQIEEREESHEGDVVFEVREDDGPQGGRIERREIRRGPGGQDVIIRRFGGPDGPGERGEGDRADHLEQAIHHLHAAGLHDMAERVEIDAQRSRIKRNGPAHDNGELRGEIERLKIEHQKLQKQLRKLQKSLAGEASEVPKAKNSKSEPQSN